MKKPMQQLLSGLLSLCLTASAGLALPVTAAAAPEAPAAAESASREGFLNFEQVSVYRDGVFDDVKETDWYRDSVATAYELGIMQGSGGSFNAAGSITLAETLVLASRFHSLYHTGQAVFVQGDPWYQVYVDYALANGLLNAPASNYNAVVTRGDFAVVLGRALPAEALPPMNDVPDDKLPDVKMTDRNAAAIYMMYRAGILTGNDSIGTFTPDTPIQRSAVAAIVTRMAYRSLRVKLDFGAPPASGTAAAAAYPDLTEQPEAEDSFFSNSAMLGNSLVQGMSLASNLRTVMRFFCYQGIGVNTAEPYLSQLCAGSYDKVYIEFGLNEIYLAEGDFTASYTRIIDRIRSVMPEAQIYVMALTPVTKARSDQGQFTMERINLYNAALYEMCKEQNCWYLDICTPLEDENGYLPDSLGGWDASPHLSVDGYLMWEQVIRTHYYVP